MALKQGKKEGSLSSTFVVARKAGSNGAAKAERAAGIKPCTELPLEGFTVGGSVGFENNPLQRMSCKDEP